VGQKQGNKHHYSTQGDNGMRKSSASSRTSSATLQNGERKLRQAVTLTPEFRAATVARCTTVLPQDAFDLADTTSVMREQAEAIQAGDMRQVEAMLINQAVALEGLFADLIRKASIQTAMPNIEGFMRLALRAQNQSRATLETLGNLKNPKAVFVRQANFSAGHQQVNNHAHAPEEKQNPQNELLEAKEHERLDTRTPSQASGIDSHMEAVGAQHRSQNQRRQSTVKPQCAQA
jgi:hypothetical protein